MRLEGSYGPVRQLKVADIDWVSALDSQAIWHAVCASCDSPTLLLMRPGSSYVSLGMHRSYDEIDHEFIARKDLPVYRRLVGGGPVYLDRNQIFFQVIVPVEMARGVRSAILKSLLEPAVQAFNVCGVKVELDSHLEISGGGRKFCGHGAGEIGRGVAVVGNLLLDFDPEMGSSILKLSPFAKAAARTLMSNHVGPLESVEVDYRLFVSALTDAYARHFAVPVETLELDRFQDGIENYREMLSSTSFVRGEELGIRAPEAIKVTKIKAGVELLSTASGLLEAFAIVNEGELASLSFVDGDGIVEGASAFERLTRTDWGSEFITRLGKMVGDKASLLKEQASQVGKEGSRDATMQGI